MSRPSWVLPVLARIYQIWPFVIKLTRVPVIKKIAKEMFFAGDSMIYLPKDDVIFIDQSLTPGSMVLPSRVLEHFVEHATYRWIMDFCICRRAGKCQDYPVDLGCLFLGEAAMDINKEWGHRATKEEALEHIRRCREAGLVHLIGKNRMDTIWLNVGPGSKLLAICHCCPCCCGWRMLPAMAPEISNTVTRMPGVTVVVTDACTGCGVCQGVCFVRAVSVVGDHAVISDECRGCGRCASACPQKAIEIVVENEGIEKSISHLSELVNVS